MSKCQEQAHDFVMKSNLIEQSDLAELKKIECFLVNGVIVEGKNVRLHEVWPHPAIPRYEESTFWSACSSAKQEVSPPQQENRCRLIVPES